MPPTVVQGDHLPNPHHGGHSGSEYPFQKWLLDRLPTITGEPGRTGMDICGLSSVYKQVVGASCNRFLERPCVLKKAALGGPAGGRLRAVPESPHVPEHADARPAQTPPS
jgi:hypothetical protein